MSTKLVAVLLAAAALALAAFAAAGQAAPADRHCGIVEAGPPGPAGDRLEVVAGGEVGIYRGRGGLIEVSYGGPRCVGAPFHVGDVDLIVLEGEPIRVNERTGLFAPGASVTGPIPIHAYGSRIELIGRSGPDRILATTLGSGRVGIDVDRRPGQPVTPDLIAMNGLPGMLRIGGEEGGDLIDVRRLTGMGDRRLRHRIRLISLGRGHDRIFGEDGNDLISYDAFSRFGGTPPDPSDELFGGRGNDTLSDRNRHADLFRCGPGRDRVLEEPHDHPPADCELR